MSKKQVIGVVGKTQSGVMETFKDYVSDKVVEYERELKLTGVHAVAGAIIWYVALPLVVDVVKLSWSSAKWLVTNPFTAKVYTPFMVGAMTKNVVDNMLGVRKDDYTHQKYDQHQETIIDVNAWESINKNSLNKQGNIHHTKMKLDRELSHLFSKENIISVVTSPSNIAGAIAGGITFAIPGGTILKILGAFASTYGIYELYQHYGNEDYEEGDGSIKAAGTSSEHEIGVGL
jgi:hypothetical protein